MPRTRTYETESKRLAKAIDIAVEAFTKVCPENFTPENQDHFIKTYLGWKDSCLNPDRKFKNLASLKYDIESVFTYFQEGTGPTVEYFWKKIAESELDYTRENRLKKILDRGKIKGRIEFEYVIDMFVVAQQNGMISRDEAVQLSDMLKTFEQRK
jgi:hypothetical protein